MLNVFDRFRAKAKICSILYKEQVTRIQLSSWNQMVFYPMEWSRPFFTS